MPTIGSSRSIYLPKPSEGSRLHGPHEASDVRQQYKGVKRQSIQADSDRQLIDSLARQVAGMRRRMLGGGGGTGGSSTNSIRGEYDPLAAYNLNDIVVISMGISQGTYACMVTGTSGIDPTVGAPNWLQLPGGLLGQWM